MTDMIFQPGKHIKEPEPEKRQGLIKTWSFSGLKEFEDCQWKSYLGKVIGVASTQHEAATRGTTIHDYAENWIKGNLSDFPQELVRFKSGFESLRQTYGQGAAHAEDEWGFDEYWNPCEWSHPDIWLRMKLDAYVIESPTSAVCIDFKTGRKDGNELTHSMQLQLYCIGAMMRDSSLEFIKAEAWYLDKGQKLEKEYTRQRAMQFIQRWEDRAHTMTSTLDFHPSPSKFKCKWCNYKDDCEWKIEQ